MEKVYTINVHIDVFEHEILNAIRKGYTIASSNIYLSVNAHYEFGSGQPQYLNFGYALCILNDTIMIPEQDNKEFYHKILEELNAIKFELSNITSNTENL